nr:hypothetical protein [Tanacetum cinerariifolium]
RELTLRVNNEAATFNLDQTSRYSANYNDMTANRIDVIDMACKEYSQKVLSFSDVIASVNPTPYYDPIVSTSSLTLTPFEDTNRIDVIAMACEEYSQEVLGFSDVIASGNPTPYYDPTISTSSPTLTPFGDSDFLLEEEYLQEVLGFSNVIASDNPTPYYDPIVSTSSPSITSFGDSDFILEEVDAFLAFEDHPTSSEVDQSYFDPNGDILLLEAFLNDDPSLPFQIKETISLKFERSLKFVKPKLRNLQLMSLS